MNNQLQWRTARTSRERPVLRKGLCLWRHWSIQSRKHQRNRRLVLSDGAQDEWQPFKTTTSACSLESDISRFVTKRTFPICGMDLTVGQELRREFNKWSTVSYAISILGVLGSVPATFGSPVNAGGPATAVWAWFIGSCMAMCIASSGTVSSDFVHSRLGTDCLLI